MPMFKISCQKGTPRDGKEEKKTAEQGSPRGPLWEDFRYFSMTLSSGHRICLVSLNRARKLQRSNSTSQTSPSSKNTYVPKGALSA